MYSPEGTGRGANYPGWTKDPGGDFDGMISSAGVTGPAGVDILHEPRCGNFSGVWWDGQVAAVRSRWHAFLTALQSLGGRVDEVVLDTERSLALEFVWNQPRAAAPLDCARLRLAAIQRDPRFDASLRDELVAGGLLLGDVGDPDALWLAVGASAASAYENATQRANGDVWAQVAALHAARAFNDSVVGPALDVFGAAVTVSDYGFGVCRHGEGFPDTYGFRGGMAGTLRGGGGVEGALVGNAAAPVCYQDFHLYSAHYFLGGPRPAPRPQQHAGRRVLQPHDLQRLPLRRLPGAASGGRREHALSAVGRLFAHGRGPVLAEPLCSDQRLRVLR
jgi:hypothetical protein